MLTGSRIDLPAKWRINHCDREKEGRCIVAQDIADVTVGLMWVGGLSFCWKMDIAQALIMSGLLLPRIGRRGG